MEKNPFEAVIVMQRSTKPRKRGITMISDMGLSLEQQKNVLSVGHSYVDLAKMSDSSSVLYQKETLTRKIDLYHEHDILTFPGGQFLEYAVKHKKIHIYMNACVSAGFTCIEVSDNLLEIDLKQKCELIRMAREDYSLRVLGEVGKKEGRFANNDLAEDAAECLNAGAEKVFLEAADFFVGEIKEKKLDEIIDRCGMDNLIFELPSPSIEGVTLSDVWGATRWLIRRFGPEVNIANVYVENIFDFESLRIGIEDV